MVGSLVDQEAQIKIPGLICITIVELVIIH